MPVYDIVPTSTDIDYSITVTGAAGAAAALSDASDSSYVSGPNGAVVRVGFDGPSSPSGRLCSIGRLARVKASGTAHWGLWMLCVSESGGLFSGPPEEVDASSSWADKEIPAYAGQNPDGSPWSSARSPLADNLKMQCAVSASGGGSALMAKLLLRLYYLAGATVDTVSAPSGTVSDTQRPECTADLSLIVESWQLPGGTSPFLTGGDVEYRIYRAADAPGSTPPSGVSPVWSGTQRFSETTAGARTPSVSITPTTPLPNGSYVVFARASRDLMSGAQLYWGDWTKSSSWTQDVPVPAAPVLTPTPDDDAQTVEISADIEASGGYVASSCQVEIQRQVGTAWRDVRDLVEIGVSTGESVEIGTDHEASRGVENTYRARVSMDLESGGRRYSAWSTATCQGPAIIDWNLKAVSRIEKSWIGADVVENPSETGQGDAAVLRPLDSDRAVVVVGAGMGADGSLEIDADGTTEIAAAEDLRGYHGLVLLETAFGDAKYIGITKMTFTRRGTTAAPVRTYNLEYAEVGCDLSEDEA